MSHHYPIGENRRSRLFTVCSTRCGTETRATDHLFKSMVTRFRDLKPEMQEQTLAAMERAVVTMRESNLIRAKPAAATVDGLVASIMRDSASTNPLSSASSSTVTTNP